MTAERLGTNIARTILGARYNEEHYYTMQNRADGLVIMEYEKGTNRLIDTMVLDDTLSEDKTIKVYDTIEPVVGGSAWTAVGVFILFLCIVGVVGILIYLSGGG